MSVDTKELSSRLAAQGAAMVPSGFEHEVKAWYAANRKRLIALVGGQEDRVALFIASAFAQVNKIPALLQVKPETFFQCVIHAMGTNLLPGPMQECVFVPFKNECTFIPMYQGLCKLAYNGGFATRISAHVVWEADVFDYDPANETILHQPFRGPEKDRGKRVAAYATILNRYGVHQREVRFAEFIESIKSRSRAAKSEYSPWNSQFPSDIDAMWCKTVFRQAVKWVPKSASPVALQMARALELDNGADTGEYTSALLSDDLLDVQKSVMQITEPQKIISSSEANE